MIDQANDLRCLVNQTLPHADVAPESGARIVLVAGGKGGVGTTTVAVNLAVAAAHGGMRTVLVDADPDGPDVQTLCRLRQQYTISDVLAGRRTLGEALQAGPAGTMILAGAWGVADLADAAESTQRRLIDQLAALAQRADLVILDGGNGLHTFTRRLWRSCDELLLVSSTEASAVLDTYAALKVAFDATHGPALHLLVNKCGDDQEALEVHNRIRRSTQRFLGFDLPRCHWLPTDPNLAAAGGFGASAALSAPESPMVESLKSLAETLTETTSVSASDNRNIANKHQTETNKDNSQDRLNLSQRNADREEDRSLFARC